MHLALLVHLAIWGLFLVPKGAVAICLPRPEPQRSQKQTRPPRGTWAATILCLCKQPVPLRAVVITQSLAELLQPCTGEMSQKKVSNHAPALFPFYIWLLHTLISRTGFARALFFPSVSYQGLGWCFNL